MIALKNFAGGMEFLITVGVSAGVGVLTFLFALLIFCVLGPGC